MKKKRVDKPADKPELVLESCRGHSPVQQRTNQEQLHLQPFQKIIKVKSPPISRVLSWTVIHLGPASPQASSDLPESNVGHTLMDSYLVLLQVGFTMP